jgi:CyaY protein
MSEQGFQKAAEATLDAIEACLERAIDDDAIDVEIERNDNVITLAFDDGSKLIVNSHSAAREIWVAARSGGFHFRQDGERWIDGRNGDELFAALSRLISAQGGAAVVLAPR